MQKKLIPMAICYDFDGTLSPGNMQEYDLIELMRNKVLITLSAGSINLCEDAICTKDEDFSVTSKYRRYGIY